jgi:trimeric autotransporter adhesin
VKWIWLVVVLAACEFPRPADVKDESVSVGGNLHGMWTGTDGVTLRLTADGVDLTYLVKENGSFTFPITLTEGASYIVVIIANPHMHTCEVIAGATGITPATGAISVDVACTGPAVSIALSAAQPWTFDPTWEVQPALEASVLLQDVRLTVDNPDGLIASARIAGVPAAFGQPSASHQLPLGSSSIDVDLVAMGGLTMMYRIVLERGRRVVEQSVYGKASNTGRGDSFGRSVALVGDTLAVGAPGEDSSATGVNGNQSDENADASGAVYIFQRSGSSWTQQAYIKASDTRATDSFGRAVALSGDTLAVAAARSGVGAVYIFRRAGGAWAQQAIVTASNGEPGDGFGFQVALSGDTLAVAAIGEGSSATGVNGDQADNSAGSAGAVYVFQRIGILWTQQAYVKASNTGPLHQFGTSLAIVGDTLAVGAPSEASGARGINGNQLDNSYIHAGAVYVFQRTGTAWSQQVYVKASNTAPLAQFGCSLALSEDTLVVGAKSEASGATGVDGDQSDANALGAGAVYVFHRTGNSWAQQAYIKASNTEAPDAFGFSVALSGSILAVNAIGEDSSATGLNGSQTDNNALDAGAVYVFRRTGTAWVQDAYVKSSNIERSDSFGSTLALSGDTLVIAAMAEDGSEIGINRNQADNRAEDAGAVYVFR